MAVPFFTAHALRSIFLRAYGRHFEEFRNRTYNRDERVRTFPCVVKPCFLKKELSEKSQR